jgi:MFS family permease
VIFVALGLGLSVALVRETSDHVALESTRASLSNGAAITGVFWRTTWSDRQLATISQVGLVNNLNDGMAWGLFPLFFAAADMSLGRIGTLAAIYPATLALSMLVTGALSDRIGRKWLIAGGMWIQAVGIGVVIRSRTFAGFAWGAVLLGIGTAMVYPTLLAAIGDVAQPSWRASAVGVYRLWRDLGYAIGALLAGITADLIGLSGAMWIVAGITLLSGIEAALRMDDPVRLSVA